MKKINKCFYVYVFFLLIILKHLVLFVVIKPENLTNWN